MEQESVAPITKEEARASLEEIDRIILLTRRTIANGNAGPILVMWGVIWMIGYGVVQFDPRIGGSLWIALDAIGIASSIYFGSSSRHSPVKGPHRGRIGLSWMILFGFAILWMYLLSSRGNYGDHRAAAYWPTIAMFAYILIGIWLDRFFIWLGALVTLATLFGFFFIGEYFYLWMAVVGGGGLVAGGWLVQKSWR
jgi:hypothetical protein